MDETGVIINPALKKTVTTKDDTQGRVLPEGNPKESFTAVCYAYADGRKGKPIILFDKHVKKECDSRAIPLFEGKWQTSEKMEIFL